MISSEISSSDRSGYTIFQIQKYLFFNENVKKLGFSFCSFFEILQKYSDFVNSNHYIGKITSKSIRLQPVFIPKKFEVNKKQIFSSEKRRNLGNYSLVLRRGFLIQCAMVLFKYKRLHKMFLLFIHNYCKYKCIFLHACVAILIVQKYLQAKFSEIFVFINS